MITLENSDLIVSRTTVGVSLHVNFTRSVRDQSLELFNWIKSCSKEQTKTETGFSKE